MRPLRQSLTSLSLVVCLAALGQTGCPSDDPDPPPATGGRGGGGGSTGGTGGSVSGGTGGSVSGGTGGTRQPDGRAPDRVRTPDGRAPDRAGSDTGGSAADNWDGYARGFFATYCVSCHNNDNMGTATRNYTMLPAVVGERARIACGVASAATWTARGCTSPQARQFPIGSGPKPSDADRDRLVRWIDSGTP